MNNISIRKYLYKIIFLLTVFMTINIGISAREISMYVNNKPVVRDIQNVDGFDMLPILDIAGELNVACFYDGKQLKIHNKNGSNKEYIFTIGSPKVYDESGAVYGLDIVPQVINGKIRIPAKFFQDVYGMSYIWDDVTKTIFMNSDNTYNWLINTPEYNGSNPKYMASYYSALMEAVDTLQTTGGAMVDYHNAYYKYDELWYYMADVNYDGILDLVISAEDYGSNGIMIISFDKIIVSHGMPYSSGVEEFTLATYNGKYGILRHRWNSADEFEFYHIYDNGNLGCDTYGHHYDPNFYINNGTVSSKVWWNKFRSIKRVGFYNFWALKNMGY